MPDISLRPMTRTLCHAFYQEFQNDPAIYMDMRTFSEYTYSPDKVDKYFDAQQEPSRVVFMILADGQPVGEGKLKAIDPERKECCLGIHLQNDSVKGKGIGTQAERLLLQYAFEALGMEAVNADVVLKNTRSQHVLEKVGFRFVREEGIFRYYRCERKKRVLVSACLLGKNCKYNGGSNYSAQVAAFVEDKEVIEICPEVMSGMGVPRTPVEIVNGVLTDRNGKNVDALLRHGVEQAMEQIQGKDIDCVILQSRSPTCGVNQVYDGSFSGRLIPGSGVFAQALREAGYPVIDAEDLL